MVNKTCNFKKLKMSPWGAFHKTSPWRFYKKPFLPTFLMNASANKNCSVNKFMPSSWLLPLFGHKTGHSILHVAHKFSTSSEHEGAETGKWNTMPSSTSYSTTITPKALTRWQC